MKVLVTMPSIHDAITKENKNISKLASTLKATLRL
jgi:hypothetical protein